MTRKQKVVAKNSDSIKQDSYISTEDKSISNDKMNNSIIKNYNTFTYYDNNNDEENKEKQEQHILNILR